MNQSVFETYKSEVRSCCRNFPAVFTKAKNATLTDQEGNQYIVFFCGAGACNYGYNNDYIKGKVMDYLESDSIIHSMDMHTVTKVEYMVDYHVEAEVQRKGKLVEEYHREKLTHRGIGLIWGIDCFIFPAGTTKCYERGLIIELAGRRDCVLKPMPPLTISDTDSFAGLNIIMDAIQILHLQ